MSGIDAICMSETKFAQMRLIAIRDNIITSARKAQRDPDAIALMAVSKTRTPDRILPLLAAGQRLFGENHVQEAMEKWPDLRKFYPDVQLHLIGPLQRNKAASAVRLFDAIHSLDRLKLALQLARIRDQTGHCPPCYIQVNIGEEPQKAGISPERVGDFIKECQTQLALPIAGLMAIPPVDDPPAPYFALLAQIADRYGFSECSMGMSGDYLEAIRFGATLVRIGTALFGERQE